MITRNELAAIRPGDRQKISEMTGILRRHWCPFAVSMGQCNKLCSENDYCAKNLEQIIDGIRPDAHRWQPVLIWRIRDRRTELKEEFERPALERNRWGEIRSGDGLQSLAAQLGVAL